MSSLLKIAAYFLGTLVLGALLAAPLCWGGRAVAGVVPALAFLRETDFHRFFDRAMLLAALLLLWPTVRALRIGSWRELGLQVDPCAGRNAAFGFVAAGGLLWVLGLGLWGTRVYEWRPQPFPWAAGAGFLGTAGAVALVEEAFFRGALYGLVRRTARAGTAVVFVAALFAILHFLKPPNAVPTADVRWYAGFVMLPRAFWQWGDPQLVLGGFTTLFAVALVLGYARWRTGALSLPIGLHAGWVFGLKSFNRCSRHVAPSSFWVGEDLLHGSLPVLAVVVTGGLVFLWLRKQP